MRSRVRRREHQRDRAGVAGSSVRPAHSSPTMKKLPGSEPPDTVAGLGVMLPLDELRSVTEPAEAAPLSTCTLGK